MKEVTYSGVGVCDVLGIVFIILKLCGVITWHWVWILSPFWIPFIFALFCMVFYKGD